MGIHDIILRTLTKAGLTTKGSRLTWADLDTNFIRIYEALLPLQALDTPLSVQGGYDCSINPDYPTSANTLLSDNPQAGYAWYITTAGTLHGITVGAGQLIFAKVDNAGSSNDSDWVIVESGFNFSDLFKNYMMSLSGYDNTKIKALCTTGSGDNFEWREFIEP